MEQQSYYRNLDDPGSNLQHESDPLVINCTGYIHLENPFMTRSEKGRLDYYLQIMTSGRLTAFPNETPEDFLPGMFIVYKPNTPYQYVLSPGEKMSYFWIHFSGFHAGRLLRNLGIEPNCIYQTDKSEKRSLRIRQNFEAIFAEFINRRSGMDEACGALLTNILVDLARGVDRVNTGEKRRLCSLAYLHQHYREETRVAELAAMEHLSESRYREIFRQHTGLSPTDYRTALRIQYACDQLAMTDSTVTNIAADCGYADVLYFLRLFKRKKGITPSEYRSQFRKS